MNGRSRTFKFRKTGKQLFSLLLYLEQIEVNLIVLKSKVSEPVIFLGWSRRWHSFSVNTEYFHSKDYFHYLVLHVSLAIDTKVHENKIGEIGKIITRDTVSIGE